MRDRVAHVDKVWRRMKLFFCVWPFWIALILVINAWQDASRGLPLNWGGLLLGIGIGTFGAVVFVSSWLILKFVRSTTAELDRER